MPNLLTPRIWRNKAIVFKDEVTYGTDPVPTGAANYFEARNVQLTSFDAETADRNIDQPFMGNGGKVISSTWSKLSFDIALAGAGAAGTAPKWGPMMLACAFSETVSAGVSVVYNLVSSAIKSGTAYMEIDGTLYKFIGCRGNIKCRMTAKGIPVLSVELTSLYTAPAAGSIAGLVRTGWTFEDAVNSVNTGKLTLNAVDLAFSSIEWDLGNQVSRIDLPGPQREAAVSDRRPTLTTTVLAPAIGTFDPYALAHAGTVVAASNTHGTVAGKKVQQDWNLRVTNVSEDNVDGMLAYKLTTELIAVNGNDELTVTVK